MMHKIRFLLFSLFLLAGLGTLIVFSDLTRSDVDERYLRIKPLETIRCKEDFPPFPVSPEINSSHPDQTRLEYTLSEGAPFTVHLDRNATRLILSPRKNRSGRGRIEIRESDCVMDELGRDPGRPGEYHCPYGF